MDAPPECSGHSHDHEHASDDLGLNLHKYIDLDHVICYNEEVPDSGRSVLKTHEERLSERPSVLSPGDGDPELLFVIPFTEAVTIQSLTIRNASPNTQSSSPKHVKVFANRDDLDFDTAREMDPQQHVTLLPPEHFVEGSIDYPCRPAGRFQNISSITIMIVDNYDDTGDSPTEITYIGFKGKGTSMKRQIVECVYESRGMLKDHKTPGNEYSNQSFV